MSTAKRRNYIRCHNNTSPIVYCVPKAKSLLSFLFAPYLRALFARIFYRLMFCRKIMSPDKPHTDKQSDSNTLLDVGYFRRIIDALPKSLQVLEPINNESAGIMGFKIIYANKTAEVLFPELLPGDELFLDKVSRKQKDFLQRLQYVITTGTASFTFCELGEGVNKDQYEERILKIEDGLIVTYQIIQDPRIDLAKQHSLLKQSEELAQSGSWEYDCLTKKLLWSDGMYRLFEMEKGIPVTPSIYLDYAIPEDRHVAEQLVNIIEDYCEPAEITLRIKTNNTIRTLHIKATALKDKKGKLQTILGIDMDITKARAAEEKIQALNKTLITKNRELENVNSELMTFNNIAANDYNETLRSLYINLENVIKADASDMSDTGKANIRKAQNSIQKMKLLTDDIVSFSRIHLLDSSIVEVDLNEILQSTLNDLDDKINESAATIDSNTLPVINGLPVLLSLLFYHLLDNAIKFREKLKAPAIKVIARGQGNFEETEPDTQYHVITITDDGIGFDGKHNDKLFTIFFRLHERTEYRGSGIGLAVCRKIMALHGGYITAEGIPGDGTVINCYFPVGKE